MWNKKSIAGGILLFAIVGIYFEDQMEFGWGYSVNWLGGIEYNVTRHEKVIVGGAIFDYQQVSGFLIGIKLPAKEIQCGRKFMRVVSDIKTYFVLDLDATQVTEYLIWTDFERVVKSLSDNVEIRLKYKIIDDIIKYGNRIDDDKEYFGCIKNNGLLGRKVIRL